MRVWADFGPGPEHLVEAERTRRAIGRVMLGVLGSEVAGLTPQQKLDSAYAEIDPDELFGSHNWYTTLAYERTVDLVVSDSLDCVFPEDIFNVAEDAQREARAGLDVIGALVASVVDIRLFDTVVLQDRVHFLAEGKRPSGAPVLTGSAETSVIRGGD